MIEPAQAVTGEAGRVLEDSVAGVAEGVRAALGDEDEGQVEDVGGFVVVEAVEGGMFVQFAEQVACSAYKRPDFIEGFSLVEDAVQVTWYGFAVGVEFWFGHFLDRSSATCEHETVVLHVPGLRHDFAVEAEGFQTFAEFMDVGFELAGQAIVFG